MLQHIENKYLKYNAHINSEGKLIINTFSKLILCTFKNYSIEHSKSNTSQTK